MNAALREQIQMACDTAREFTKFYYESVDKKRHQIARLYSEQGMLVWNGNGTGGNTNIQQYFQTLPPSDHLLLCLDAQPFIGETFKNPPTVMIQSAGIVRFKDNQPKPFQQTFILTAIEGKWKIISDCYRLQDALAAQQRRD